MGKRALARPSEKNDKKEKEKKEKEKNSISTSETKIRKKRRHRPYKVALMNVRRESKDTDLILRKKPFQELVREITDYIRDELKLGEKGVRMRKTALEAIHHITEHYITSHMGHTKKIASYSKRMGITVKDMNHLDEIRLDHKYKIPAPLLDKLVIRFIPLSHLA